MSKHEEDCKCHLHTEQHCSHCSWNGMGTTRLGMHIKKYHPEHFYPKRTLSATRLASKALQAHHVAAQMKSFGERGLRFLPKSRLDKQTREMVEAWIKQMTDSSNVSENLLVQGLVNAERGVQSIREFHAIGDSIKESMKLKTNNLPGLYSRSTLYNTQVAMEVLKLAFALNKSWSFSIHLLLLYGLRALAEELSTTGALVPTYIMTPTTQISKNEKEQARQLVQKGRDEAFLARNPNFDPNNRPVPYVIKSSEGVDLDI